MSNILFILCGVLFYFLLGNQLLSFNLNYTGRILDLMQEFHNKAGDLLEEVSRLKTLNMKQDVTTLEGFNAFQDRERDMNLLLNKVKFYHRYYYRAKILFNYSYSYYDIVPNTFIRREIGVFINCLAAEFIAPLYPRSYWIMINELR